MPDEMTDIDVLLWEAMVDGDRVSLARLYDRHVSALLAIGLRMLGTAAEAEDLVHDILLEAWEHGERFDPRRGSVRTWLALRTRSRALDRLRSRGRRRETDAPAGDADLELPAPDDPTLVAEIRQLRNAFVNLPEAPRHVLALAYFEGLSGAEIASRLGLPVGTVRSRTAAGLARLRVALGDTPPAPGREEDDR